MLAPRPLSVALGGEGCRLHRSCAGRSNEPPRALGVYVRKGAAQPLPSRQETAHVLSLCILQAGLSWASVRRSWPRYRSAFLDFEIAKLAHATPAALLRRPGALRNRKKVAALVANAQEFERIRAEHGTFARYLRTVKSDKDACTILQERFRHVGPYTAEFYLHSVGRSVYGS